MTKSTSGGCDQFETSPEASDQELRTAFCKRRQTDRLKTNYRIDWHLHYYRSAVLKFCEFLAARSKFDNDHGVDFAVPTRCQSATFVRPLFAFYCPLYFYEK